MSVLICLVVDDEQVVRTYVSALLERENIQSLAAENAVAALKIVHRLSGSLDLVISDITMPGDMTGVDLAYSIRNTFPSIPIILISGNADAFRNKACGFHLIQKPFTPETLLKTIRDVLLG